MSQYTHITHTFEPVFDRHSIGRAYWNYKEKDFGIINIEDKEVQKELGRLL